MTELFLEVQVVKVLAIASLWFCLEALLLQSSLEVEGGLAIGIDFCYYAHTIAAFSRNPALRQRQFAGFSLFHRSQTTGTGKTIACDYKCRCTSPFCK